MEIHGPGKPPRTNPVTESRRSRAGAPPGKSSTGAERSSDAVELSNTGRILSNLARVPDVRQARVDEVKALVARGEYDTDERLKQALDNLLDEIVGPRSPAE